MIRLNADPAPASPLRRFLLAAAMALILGGLAGLLLAQARSPEPAAARFTPPREQAFDFELRDQDGRPTSLADARGKVVVLTFLYTSCWDLCPAQAADVARRRRARGRRGAVIYVVSVDPAGDTQEHVRHWLDEHGFAGKPIKYLIGTREQLAPRVAGVRHLSDRRDGRGVRGGLAARTRSTRKRKSTRRRRRPSGPTSTRCDRRPTRRSRDTPTRAT